MPISHRARALTTIFAGEMMKRMDVGPKNLQWKKNMNEWKESTTPSKEEREGLGTAKSHDTL